MLSPACPVCSSLKAVETSFSKYGAPDLDRPLPEAAARLIRVHLVGIEAAEKSHVRRCPVCASLFSYRLIYEYQVNGSEDEETLTRLSPDEAAAFRRREAIRLENDRREIDRLETEAGALGDYIDRGHPTAPEERDAFDRMQAGRRAAAEGRERLQAQVEAFRATCPEILRDWAEAHCRVCAAYLEAGFPPGPDASTMRFSAQSILEAWQALPRAGETFISTDTVFLPGYSDRLDAEMSPGEAAR